MLKSTFGWLVVAAAMATACGPSVGMLPAKTCAGGNVKDCRARCDQGDGESCYRLGWFYEEGEVFDGSIRKAVKLYERACEANWAVSCRALGILYWQGEDVDRNPKKAVKYYRKACGLGLVEACPTKSEIALVEGRKSGSASGAGSSMAPKPPKAPDVPAPSLP